MRRQFSSFEAIFDRPLLLHFKQQQTNPGMVPENLPLLFQQGLLVKLLLVNFVFQHCFEIGQRRQVDSKDIQDKIQLRVASAIALMVPQIAPGEGTRFKQQPFKFLNLAFRNTQVERSSDGGLINDLPTSLLPVQVASTCAGYSHFLGELWPTIRRERVSADRQEYQVKLDNALQTFVLPLVSNRGPVEMHPVEETVDNYN